MTRTAALPTVPATSLPRLVYAHSADHDPALTEPQNFRPIATGNCLNKPANGGLWTAPVTETAADGTPLCTAWTDWCAENMWGTDSTDRFQHNARFIEIIPNEGARVLRVDTLADLRAIITAYLAAPLFPGQRLEYPDWYRMAAAGWDAVWLTDAGQWATRLTDPGLYGWDCESVLWLRPAYSCKAVTR